MNYFLQKRLERLLKKMPLYRKERCLVLDDFSESVLLSSLKQAVKDVPYYAKYHKRNLSLHDFPVLRKSDIIGHEEDFVSRKRIKFLMHKVKTGGSTGQSLQLYYSLSTLLKKDVVSDYAFSLIGENLRTAVLRGNKPKDEQIFEVVDTDTILFSSYFLSEETLDAYLGALKLYEVECIHAYPSSLTILARLIKKNYGVADLPALKGIFTSSEIFSKEDKNLVHEVFPSVKMVDYYGHNELACCALSIDGGFYHFFDNFGFVEFIETGEVLANGNRIAEIVATSIMNSDQPFIRYGTDDFVELDSANNVVSIIGRTSDFLVDANLSVVPCIIHTRYESKKNVIAFQFYQEKVGELLYKIVVNNHFNAHEAEMLAEDLKSSFRNMNCKVVVVEQIERTKRGKQMRLIQKLDVRKFL